MPLNMKVAYVFADSILSLILGPSWLQSPQSSSLKVKLEVQGRLQATENVSAESAVI